MTATASLTMSKPENFDAELLKCRKFLHDKQGWALSIMRKMLRGELKTFEQLHEDQMDSVRYFQSLGVIFESQYPDDYEA